MKPGIACFNSLNSFRSGRRKFRRSRKLVQAPLVFSHFVRKSYRVANRSPCHDSLPTQSNKNRPQGPIFVVSWRRY